MKETIEERAEANRRSLHNPGEIGHEFRRMPTTDSGVKRPLFQEIPEALNGFIGSCSRQPILIPFTHHCRFRQKFTPFSPLLTA